MSASMGITASTVDKLRQLVHRNAPMLGLQPSSIRTPRPGVITGRTSSGELITIEIQHYPRGQA